MNEGVRRFRLPSRLNAQSAPSKTRAFVFLGGFLGINALRSILRAIPGTGAAPSIVFFGAAVLLIAVLLLPSWVEVGVDGVLVRWLGTRKLIPFATLQKIDRYQRAERRSIKEGLLLTSASGEVVDIPVVAGGFSATLLDVENSIWAAFNAFRERTPHDEVLLSRGTRDSRAWAKDLRQLCSPGREDMRVAPVQPENLWRVLENPAQNAETRAAAAVALRPTLDAEGKQRIRIAAADSVDDKLKKALDRIAQAEEEEMELEALDQVAPRRLVRGE